MTIDLKTVLADTELLYRNGADPDGITPAALAALSAFTSVYAVPQRSVVLLPWAAKTTTSGTFIIGASDVGPILQFGTAQNSEISWDVAMAAGTWEIGFTHSRDTDRGIYSIQFNTVEVGTVDGYNGSSSFILSKVTGLTVATSGIVEVKLKTANKNASSSSYKGLIGSVMLARTGA